MPRKPSYADLEKRLEALQNENSYYRMVAENATDMLSKHDPDGVCKYASPSFRHLLGYKPEEMIGRNAIDFFHPDDLEKIQKSYRDILEKEMNASVSYRIKHEKGHYIWVRSTGRTIRNPKTNEIEEIIATTYDLTELTRTERELESQNRFMGALLDNLRVGVFMVEAPSGKPILANTRAMELLGRGIMNGAEKDTLAETYQAYRFGTRELYPPDQMPVVRALHGESRSIDDMLVVHPDGTEVLLEVFGSPIRDNQGQIIAGLVSFSDITERKKQDEALRQSEETLRSIFKAAPIGIGMVCDRVITQANERLCEMVGRSQADLVNKNARILYPSEADYKYVGKAKYDQIREKGTGTVETRWQHKSGIISDILLSSTPINPDDWSEGVTFTALDITDRKQMEDGLRQAQKMESIGNLAGGIAHDFNNILFPIIGLSELLIQDLKPESLEHQNVQQILQAGKRGRDLIKQILAFSRQSEHRMIPVRIQQIMKEVLKLSRSSIPADIDIVQDIQSDCGLVMADPTQIHQLAMNLITNAYHAVEPKGGNIMVQLKEVELNDTAIESSSLEPGPYARLTISDTGCGIDASMRNKIFEPYFNTKEKSKGTGLGLSVVYGIAKEHGGDINVQSELNQYTTFDVYLPLLTDGEELPQGIKKAEVIEKGNERILLVDDEEPIAQFEKQMLERYGYQVEARFSSMDALAAFKANPKNFDLIITDMTMPNLTGDKLAKEVLSIRPGIPIIICTGFSTRINEQKARAMGIKGFLFKPVAGAQMAKLVRDVLDEVKGSQ